MTDKTHYVYSTLSSAVDYPVYTAGGGDIPTAEKHIVIQGGANIPDKYMRTPDGAVITPVTAEELEALQANSVFKLHQANGFIVVKDKKAEPEKVAADMTTRDQSAPLVDGDFEAQGQPAPVTKSDDDDKPAAKPSGRRA